VHPPGIVYLLAPLGWLGPNRALAAGRLLMVGVGAASIVLAALIARRAWGPFAGVVAAAVYAAFPEAVRVEHGVFIEPFLNALCLGALYCWLRAHSRDQPARLTRSWGFGAGILMGTAVGFKLWAALLLIALFTAPPVVERTRQLRHFAVGFVGTSLVLWVPMLIGGANDVIKPVVEFQLDRPPDGVIGRLERFRSLVFDWSSSSTVLSSRHVGFVILVVAGIALGAWRRRFAATERIAAVWLALLLLAFLSASAYWDQYNAALAPSAALLAGFGCSPLPTLLRHPKVAPRSAAVGALLIALVAVVLGVRTSWSESRTSGRGATLVSAAIRENVPAHDCVLAFEPGWLLGADRLPVTEGRFPPVDPYASELMRADDAMVPHASTAEKAFRDQPFPTSTADEFAPCRFVALGSRGRAQLNPAQLEWFTNHFKPVTDTAELWVRTN